LALIHCSEKPVIPVEDLIDHRIDKEATSSLEVQKSHAETWKMHDGYADVTVVSTFRRAVEVVRDKYNGANVLVTGSHYLVGGAIHTLRVEK